MRREGEINLERCVQSFSFYFWRYRKRGSMGRSGRSKCLSKIILLPGKAARWHSAAVEKGGREGGGEMRKASRQANGEYSTQSHVEHLGETHGNNMYGMCEIVIAVILLTYRMCDINAKWRTLNDCAKCGEVDKYDNVQIRSPYQPCNKLRTNASVKQEKIGNYWNVETCWSSVENVCSLDYQLNPRYIIVTLRRDIIELVSETRFAKLKIASIGSLNTIIDNQCEPPLQLQSYCKIGSSSLCGAESQGG
jgi:hypothetical protein